MLKRNETPDEKQDHDLLHNNGNNNNKSPSENITTGKTYSDKTIRSFIMVIMIIQSKYTVLR